MSTRDARGVGAHGGMSRRTFLRLGAAAAAGPSLLGLEGARVAWAEGGQSGTATPRIPGELRQVEEATIAGLQGAMDRGELTAVALLNIYLHRTKLLDPLLRSIIELNPDAHRIAAELDRERRENGPRGPLHGIPVLLKDNIDTADKMTTTAGSLALEGSYPPQDAFVAQKLREAGAVLFGKANMTEWANFRSTQASSGWSARGGQGNNPYVLDRNPCGSSSGSGQAVAANLVTVSLGTETNGSIVCPANANGLVGIKPTVGLTSRAGVIPISHSQDTVGPLARSVADAAAILGAIVGVDPRDPATRESRGKFFTDYTQFLDPKGLKGARIGVARKVYFGYSPEADAIVNGAIEAMKAAGAEIVDPADIPTAEEISQSNARFEVQLYEFKHDINQYLASLGPDAPARTLEDLIQFNEEHAEEEMKYFGQEIFLMAQEKGGLDDPAYLQALEESHRLSRTEGLDKVLNDLQLDALMAPTGSPAWRTDLINGDHFLGGSSSPAAMAGYPLISVPAGYSFGLPVNLTLMGRAYSEPTLIKLAYAFEQATKVRRAPEFLPTLHLE